MTIYSYVVSRIEDGGRTGVPRFDSMLRRVFPEMRSVTKLPALAPDDVVITDNHLSLDAPEGIKTIVVHHGCAATHYERDPQWQHEHTRQIVTAQREMFLHPNRIYVAPSWWVGREFCEVCPKGIDYSFKVIPHWVEPIEKLPGSWSPVIIGDWRDFNKGGEAWKRLAALCPQWEFRPLNFRDDAGRRKQYGEANLYLCLSLSEGGSYSMCDAEAAGLPIVTTDVGNFREFLDCEVIRWQDRDDVGMIIAAIGRKLNAGRVKPSFYAEYDFERWAASWREVVG